MAASKALAPYLEQDKFKVVIGNDMSTSKYIQIWKALERKTLEEVQNLRDKLQNRYTEEIEDDDWVTINAGVMPVQ